MRHLGHTFRPLRTNGLTILEIALMLFLFILLAASFLSIQKRKSRNATQAECTQIQWRWMQLADDLEMKLRKWEAVGGACLTAGVSPLRVEENHVTLLEAMTSRPLVQDMDITRDLRVPPEHDFMVGQQIVICSPDAFLEGTIKRIEIGTTNSLLSISFGEEMDPSILLPRQSLVVAMTPHDYVSRPSENPLERVLYEQRSATDLQPIESGFDLFALEWLSTEAPERAKVRMKIALKECALEREFPVYFSSIDQTRGQWMLAAGKLAFKPWPIADSEDLRQ